MVTVLPKAFSALKEGGVLCVISFHSLEDRIVKRFCAGNRADLSINWTLAFWMKGLPTGEMLNTKAVLPSRIEVDANPRSRSARLRAIRKLKHQE